jgi:Spy/CpxP family protein refolding chaperone
MTHLVRTASLALVLWLAFPAGAQELAGPPMRPPAFLKQLFIPALVMAHQHEIDLTAAQRDAIAKDMSETQKKILELRWGLDEKSEELEKLLAADKIDENAALARAAAVLDVEREIKQTHLGLLIRIKNLLTPAQRAKLAELRPREQGRFHHGMHGGPPAE